MHPWITSSQALESHSALRCDGVPDTGAFLKVKNDSKSSVEKCLKLLFGSLLCSLSSKPLLWFPAPNLVGVWALCGHCLAPGSV